MRITMITKQVLLTSFVAAFLMAGCRQRCEYACHDFSQGPEPIARGEAHASWFKADDSKSFSVGISAAIPRGANVFGIIAFRYGTRTLVYPLYSWEPTPELDYTFACNGPRGFTPMGTNKTVFLSLALAH